MTREWSLLRRYLNKLHRLIEPARPLFYEALLMGPGKTAN